MKLDNKMKRLLREMGEAINDSLSTSDELSATIESIRQEGYDVFLILEATIGLNPRSGEDDEEKTESRLPAASIEISEGKEIPQPTKDKGKELVFQVSPDDEQFLRSLRISINDAGTEPEDGDTDGEAGSGTDLDEE